MNATSEEDINLNFPLPRDGAGSSQNNSDSSESRATTAFQAITDSSRDRTESGSTAYERKTEPGKQTSDVHVTTLPPLAEHTASSSLRKTRWQSLYLIIKRLLPCVLTIFLASIFVVNKRIAFLSGTAEYSFLIIVIYTLFFHPAQHTVGKHIQVTGMVRFVVMMSVALPDTSMPLSHRYNGGNRRNRLVSSRILPSMPCKSACRHIGKFKFDGCKSSMCHFSSCNSVCSCRSQITLSTLDDWMPTISLYDYMASCCYCAQPAGMIFFSREIDRNK